MDCIGLSWKKDWLWTLKNMKEYLNKKKEELRYEKKSCIKLWIDWRFFLHNLIRGIKKDKENIYDFEETARAFWYLKK